jgi:type III secretion system chaperone SycN
MNHELMIEFGRRLGLENIDAGQDPLVFDLEGLGQLTLESAETEDLLVSLAVPLPPYDEDRLLAALKSCYPDTVFPFPLGCGLHGDRLIFMSRQNRAGLTAATLENLALFLIRHAKAAGF